MCNVHTCRAVFVAYMLFTRPCVRGIMGVLGVRFFTHS